MSKIKIIIYSSLYMLTIAIFISTFVFQSHPIENTPILVLRTIIVLFATILLTKYTLYLLVCPWYETFGKPEKKQQQLYKNYEPLVSVIIPAWNEEVGLLATIKTLLASSYRNMELVVVNDGSTDRSDQMMREFQTKYDRETAGMEGRIALVYHYQQNGGKGSALNTGIRLSHGEILISIDADCIVHEHAIRNFVKCFRDPEVMSAVGNVRIGNKKSLVGTIQYLEYLFSFYFKKADSILNTIYIVGGAAGAYRREVFEKLGPYSTKNITEDIELSVRIQKAGMKIVYAPDAVIITEGASDVKGLMKQRLRWKRGRFETFSEHRDLFFSLKKHHNKLLTWVVLPLAVFGELQLGLELLFILLLYIFSFITSDFSAFISGVVVVSLIFFIQIFEDKEHRKLSYLFLAPIGWLLFYFTTLVEFNALLKSLWGLIRKKELKWQKWQRQGAVDSNQKG